MDGVPAAMLSQDLCHCGHAAVAHRDGEGECGTCAALNLSAWAQLARCRRFNWSMKWEEASA